MRYVQSLGIVLTLAVALALAPAALAQEAAGPKDHALIYKQAVALIDKADKKLAANYTAEAKASLKEASSLFKILQTELAGKLQEQELSDTQADQEKANRKLADDTFAQAERLEKSAQEKEKKSQAAETKGQDQVSIKLQSEAKKEYELAQKLFLKAQIVNLRNLQVAFAFLGR